MGLKHTIDHGITFRMDFAEMEACIAAGLDPWLWEQDNYPIEFKARIVAWWELHNAIQAHSQDAAADKSARDSKKASLRRR